MFIDHSIYYIVPGDVVLIEPRRLHQTTYESEAVTERIVVCFSDDILEQMKLQCSEEGVRRAIATVSYTHLVYCLVGSLQLEQRGVKQRW